MTTAFDDVVQAAQSENPFFPKWARPGSDVSVVVDRILVNPDAVDELLFSDYSPGLEDAQEFIETWVRELQDIKTDSCLSWSQRVRSRLFGTSFSAEITKTAADRFESLRENFDDIVSSRLSALVNSEAAVIWLETIMVELTNRKGLHEGSYEKLMVLNHYKQSLREIAALDQAIIQRLQHSELLMKFTAMDLAMKTTVAEYRDSKINNLSC